MRIILFFFFTLLFGDEKLLISKFENLKPYYYQNQIVNLKLKIISAKDGNLVVIDDRNITYPVIKNEDDYISNVNFRLDKTFPKIFVKLEDENGKILDSLKISIDSKIKELYPPSNFCNVLANNLIITDKILTNYDIHSNIVYWTITAKNGDVKDFKLNLPNEKLFFLDKNNSSSSYSYSAIVPLNKKEFQFSYFNLIKEKYELVKFKIKLKNETVSTQIDIKPMAKSNLYILNGILTFLILLWGILYFYKRKISYIILIILGIGSLVFFNFPKKEIILKEGTEIHILPFKNSTVFSVIAMNAKVKVLDEKNGYKKIEFNKYIGWVKDNE